MKSGLIFLTTTLPVARSVLQTLKKMGTAVTLPMELCL